MVYILYIFYSAIIIIKPTCLQVSQATIFLIMHLFYLSSMYAHVN